LIADLLCEGACNPTLPALDAAVAKERSAYAYHGEKLLSVSEPLLELLNALHHTPHLALTDTRWKCAECGHARQWGM
jgi:hypothetical protein